VGRDGTATETRNIESRREQAFNSELSGSALCFDSVRLTGWLAIQFWGPSRQGGTGL